MTGAIILGMATNDRLRKKLHKMFISKLGGVNKLMKYFSLRGFAGVPPAYQHVPAGNNEKIHCGEAGGLWDLLTYRYDTLRFTQTTASMVHDKEFKIIISAGIKLLEKQIKVLEDELMYFGIQMPKRPADVTAEFIKKELLEDSHIFRMTFLGMQGAAALHVRAFKRFSINHRLRGIVSEILLQEIEKIDDFIRYGKAKGWLYSVPKYGP